MARHWFHGRFQASALPLVKLWAVLRSERLPEGPGRPGPPLVSWTVPSLRSPPGNAVGSSAKRKSSRGARQPGPPLDSQRFQAAFWAPFPTPYPGGQGQPRFRREQRAGWADAPLPSPAVQGAPILPGGQWRPGFGRESSGRPGRHPPLDGCRPARGPGGLPGRSLSLSLGRESEARTSGATGVSYLREGPAGKKKGFRGFPRLFVTFSRQRK